MSVSIKPQGKRIINLVKAVRQVGILLPGDEITLVGEAPATYLGAFEEGDIQTDYLQLHTFTLSDGIQVVLEIPSLNRNLGKLFY